MALCLFMAMQFSTLTQEHKPAYHVSGLNFAMPTLQERLEEIMTAKDWGYQDLVQVSGESRSVVSQWLGRGSKTIKSIGKTEAAERIEAESGFAALWIAKGLGDKLASPFASNLEAQFSQLMAAMDIPCRLLSPKNDGDKIPIWLRTAFGEGSKYVPDFELTIPGRDAPAFIEVKRSAFLGGDKLDIYNRLTAQRPQEFAIVTEEIIASRLEMDLLLNRLKGDTVVVPHRQALGSSLSQALPAGVVRNVLLLAAKSPRREDIRKLIDLYFSDPIVHADLLPKIEGLTLGGVDHAAGDRNLETGT